MGKTIFTVKTQQVLHILAIDPDESATDQFFCFHQDIEHIIENVVAFDIVSMSIAREKNANISTLHVSR
jgi:hypothetical protein